MTEINKANHLQRQLIPLLREAFLWATEAPKTPADDLMLTLCADLLNTPAERAREFYSHPFARPGQEEGSFSSLVAEDSHTFFRYYSRRALWLSLQEQSPLRLRTGLLACALSSGEVADWRDLLVSLAPYHHCAQLLQMNIPEFFLEGSRFAHSWEVEHFQTFGQRKDVTLGVFGWREVETANGIRFRQW